MSALLVLVLAAKEDSHKRVDLVGLEHDDVMLLVDGAPARIDWPTLRRAANQDDEHLAGIHAAILAAAETLRDETARLRSMRAPYRACISTGHVVARSDEPKGFSGPVATTAENINPAAHGNVSIREHCHCGARRDRLVNQRHEEIGEWQ